MRYFFDTEFIDQPYTLDMISIGIVAEDGRDYYAESSEVDWSRANKWTLANVKPQLEGFGMEREKIGYAIRRFTEGDSRPEFWGYFPSHDWVMFCWLFGGMSELPFSYPQHCLDLRQWAMHLGDPELPHPSGARHNALADALWTKQVWEFLAKLDPEGAVNRSRVVG